MIMVYCFCFSQETAYEMRNSDWSSDVCSSDLPGAARAPGSGGARGGRRVSPPSAACMAAPLAPSAHQGGDGLDRGAPRRYEGFARKNRGKCRVGSGDGRWNGGDGRSEEHTSELQSLMRISYAGFCLKKQQHYIDL